MTRISVPWTTARCSSASVSAAGAKSGSRDQRPKYIDGAYWAWIPHSRSSAPGSVVSARSSSSWRASSARLSSRGLSVRTRRTLRTAPTRRNPGSLAEMATQGPARLRPLM